MLLAADGQDSINESEWVKPSQLSPNKLLPSLPRSYVPFLTAIPKESIPSNLGNQQRVEAFVYIH
jgi:hypothetical protein